MLQDIAPHRFRNEYQPREPQGGDYLFCFSGDMLLLKEGRPHPEIPLLQELPTAEQPSAPELEYLFSVDGKACFLACDRAESAVFRYHEARTVFRNLSAWRPLAVATAYQLQRWYRDNQYCGRCAQPLSKSPHERALLCPACQAIEYPKIAPVVMVGIIDQGRLLLTKYADRPSTNYALIAGFVEIGENLEEAARREVLEEVGLKIGGLHYYKSQPWGISDSLLAGFFAQVEGSNTVRLDHKELAESRWFLPKELPPPASSLSLTQTMIEAFRQGEIKLG